MISNLCLRKFTLEALILENCVHLGEAHPLGEGRKGHQGHSAFELPAADPFLLAS